MKSFFFYHLCFGWFVLDLFWDRYIFSAFIWRRRDIHFWLSSMRLWWFWFFYFTFPFMRFLFFLSCFYLHICFLNLLHFFFDFFFDFFSNFIDFFFNLFLSLLWLMSFSVYYLHRWRLGMVFPSILRLVWFWRWFHNFWGSWGLHNFHWLLGYLCVSFKLAFQIIFKLIISWNLLRIVPCFLSYFCFNVLFWNLRSIC